mmetsp:Transcript_28739/g.79135  ORF Transcript_28739/g.79135 Transcript_28739/m.79135 type:complete len:383 (+) Transcript_28739:212-1360(+)
MTTLRVDANVDLRSQLRRQKPGKLRPESRRQAWKHRGTPGHNQALDKILLEIQVACLDGLHADFLHRKHVLLAIAEQDLRRTSPNLVVHLDDGAIGQLKGLGLLIGKVWPLRCRAVIVRHNADLLLQRLHHAGISRILAALLRLHHALDSRGDVLAGDLHFEDRMWDCVPLEDRDSLGQPFATFDHEASCSASGEQAEHRGVENGQGLYFLPFEHHLCHPLPRGVSILTERQGVGDENGQLLSLDPENCTERMLPQGFQHLLGLRVESDLPAVHRPREGCVSLVAHAHRFVTKVDGLALALCCCVGVPRMFVLARGFVFCRGRSACRKTRPGRILAGEADLQVTGTVIEHDDILFIHSALQLHSALAGHDSWPGAPPGAPAK